VASTTVSLQSQPRRKSLPGRVWARTKSSLRLLAPVLTVGAVLLTWELWVRIGHVQPYVMPTFTDAAKAMWTDGHLLLPDLWITLKEIIFGLSLAIGVGIPLAILIVSFQTIEYCLYPLLVASQVIPKLAIAPLFVIWFGFGWLPKTLLVFSICFFPIVIDSTLGFRNIEREKLYLASSMGAGTITTFRRFRFPQALPNIFVGIKLAVTLAVIGAIVAEFVGSDSGIGHRLIIANANLDTPMMFAAIGYVTILGIVLFLLADLAERLLLPWHASRRDPTVGTT
jgi:NitT/TauT family transport system permease protein